MSPIVTFFVFTLILIVSGSYFLNNGHTSTSIIVGSVLCGVFIAVVTSKKTKQYLGERKIMTDQTFQIQQPEPSQTDDKPDFHPIDCPPQFPSEPE